MAEITALEHDWSISRGGCEVCEKPYSDGVADEPCPGAPVGYRPEPDGSPIYASEGRPKAWPLPEGIDPLTIDDGEQWPGAFSGPVQLPSRDPTMLGELLPFPPRQKSKVARNAPCSCGSGKKAKKCCHA